MRNTLCRRRFGTGVLTRVPFCYYRAVTEDRSFPTRRAFLRRSFGTVASVGLLQTILGCTSSGEGGLTQTNPVVAPKVVEKLGHWSLRLEEACRDLRKGSLTVVEWQDALADLYGQIELGELLRFIDFERLRRAMKLPDLGVTTKSVAFPGIEGLPEKTTFVKKVFGMREGRAIIPHGHSNMASGHLILAGQSFLRQFDKLRKTKTHLEIRETVAKGISAGDFSSISDERDNVHWFVAEKGPLYTFDVIMLDLGGEKYDIHNIDIVKAESVENGVRRAPLIGVEKALRKYGKDHHNREA